MTTRARLQEIAMGTGIGGELATAMIALEDGFQIVMNHRGLGDCEANVESLKEQRELLKAENDELRAQMSDLHQRAAAIQEAYDESRRVGMWRERAEWARQADLDAPWPPSQPEDSDTAAKRRMLCLSFISSAGLTVATFWFHEGSTLGLSGRLEDPEGATTEFDLLRVAAT